MKLLSSYKFGFDCASKSEMETILGLGVSPDRIVYANTIKQVSNLQYAARNKVSMLTVDCEDELIKVKNVYPGAKILLRIWTDGSKSSQSVSNIC